MKKRGNYKTMRKVTYLYIKEIHVIKVVKYDHFNYDQGDQAHLA
jgi:hypothetical protein